MGNAQSQDCETCHLVVVVPFVFLSPSPVLLTARIFYMPLVGNIADGKIYSKK
jgi:hypothetical protein